MYIFQALYIINILLNPSKTSLIHNFLVGSGDPKGIRTPDSAVKGRRLRPLVDGTVETRRLGREIYPIFYIWSKQMEAYNLPW